MSGRSRKVPPPGGVRLGLGMALFGLGLVCPVFVPLVAASDLPAAWSTTLSGLLVLGLPELFWVAAAAVLGRQGFELLKGRLLRVLRREVFPERVGRSRYRLGLVLFVLPLLYGWLGPYVAELLPGSPSQPLAAVIAGDVVLLASLVVLGGAFWDKLRALFLYDAKAVLPGSVPGRAGGAPTS